MSVDEKEGIHGLPLKVRALEEGVLEYTKVIEIEITGCTMSVAEEIIEINKA